MDQHDTTSDTAFRTHMALVYRTSDMLYVYLYVYFLGMLGATDTKLGDWGKSEQRSRYIMASNDEHFVIHLTACILGYHQSHLRLEPDCTCSVLIYLQVSPTSGPQMVYTFGPLL